MTAYNAVRFRVKPGKDDAFVTLHREVNLSLPGLRKAALVRTGERTYCFIGEWEGMSELAAARPAMITVLDRARPLLEDLGGGLGVTDPVSGEAVVEVAGDSVAGLP